MGDGYETGGPPVGHMPNPDNTPDDERRVQFDGYLSQFEILEIETKDRFGLLPVVRSP